MMKHPFKICVGLLSCLGAPIGCQAETDPVFRPYVIHAPAGADSNNLSVLRNVGTTRHPARRDGGEALVDRDRVYRSSIDRVSRLAGALSGAIHAAFALTGRTCPSSAISCRRASH